MGLHGFTLEGVIAGGNKKGNDDEEIMSDGGHRGIFKWVGREMGREFPFSADIVE